MTHELSQLRPSYLIDFFVSYHGRRHFLKHLCFNGVLMSHDHRSQYLQIIYGVFLGDSNDSDKH